MLNFNDLCAGLLLCYLFGFGHGTSFFQSSKLKAEVKRRAQKITLGARPSDAATVHDVTLTRDAVVLRSRDESLRKRLRIFCRSQSCCRQTGRRRAAASIVGPRNTALDGHGNVEREQGESARSALVSRLLLMREALIDVDACDEELLTVANNLSGTDELMIWQREARPGDQLGAEGIENGL